MVIIALLVTWHFKRETERARECLRTARQDDSEKASLLDRADDVLNRSVIHPVTLPLSPCSPIDCIWEDPLESTYVQDSHRFENPYRRNGYVIFSY
jgi:hypothetical protein